MPMDSRVTTLVPDGLARPGGHYSHARRFAGLVFTSGQLPVRADGSHTADLAFEEQARQALENMLSALRAAGARDIVGNDGRDAWIHGHHQPLIRGQVAASVRLPERTTL